MVGPGPHVDSLQSTIQEHVDVVDRSRWASGGGDLVQAAARERREARLMKIWAASSHVPAHVSLKMTTTIMTTSSMAW